MASTNVEIRDNRELRRVEALDEDGQVAGFAQYQVSVDGDTFDFQHTEVDERFEGEGIGTRLAAGVMDFVREEGLKIVPSCSFLRHYMEKNEDTHDLLAADASLDSDDGREHETEDEDGTEGKADAPSTEAVDEAGQDDQDSDDQDSDDDSDDDDDRADDDEDDDDDDDSDDEADVDSPDAGPADAKAAGAGGATDEEASRS